MTLISLYFILAQECYIENNYVGFREKTKSLHQCVEGRCKFDRQSKGKPGCLPNSKMKKEEWEECSVPKCSKNSFLIKIKSNSLSEFVKHTHIYNTSIRYF